MEMDGRQIYTDLVTLLDAISPASEAYRRLQSNLPYSQPEKTLPRDLCLQLQ